MGFIAKNFDDFVEYIVSAFEAEMHIVERSNTWKAILSGNPYSAQEVYTRSKRIGQEHEEQRNALRRALRRVLGTEEQQAEMMLPAATEAVERAIGKLIQGLNGNFR